LDWLSLAKQSQKPSQAKKPSQAQNQTKPIQAKPPTFFWFPSQANPSHKNLLVCRGLVSDVKVLWDLQVLSHI
jgi:hypothetical protein